MPWTTSRDQVELPADDPHRTWDRQRACACERTGTASRLVEVSPRPRGGTMTMRYGIPGVDGRRGRSECRIEGASLEENGADMPQRLSRGNATGSRPFKDTDTPDVHRVRQGRLPRSPRAPIIVERRKTTNEGRSGSARPSSQRHLECVGGTPTLGGGEKKRGRV